MVKLISGLKANLKTLRRWRSLSSPRTSTVTRRTRCRHTSSEYSAVQYSIYIYIYHLKSNLPPFFSKLYFSTVLIGENISFPPLSIKFYCLLFFLTLYSPFFSLLFLFPFNIHIIFPPVKLKPKQYIVIVV